MSKVTRRLTSKQPVDPVRRLFEDLNQPSEARLKQALRARQIPFTDEEVANIVKGSTAKQVFAPKPRADGKVVSTHKNARWAADLVDMTATPSKDGQNIYIGCAGFVFAADACSGFDNQSTKCYSNSIKNYISRGWYP